ncbi:cell division protein FtsX [Agrilactobacillus composti DSM 18527 = JCM 14202]|nr:permease-like cell division protein FtsX [Agrilactobacillus composti]GAF41081.1 cell division protein FtsX [Agrilactobacillus composti DSM 18527 = JCM 14202]
MPGYVIKRHVKDSFKSLKRNGWMSFAAISAVAVTLMLLGIFLALILNVNRLSNQIENDVRVRVLIERGTTPKQKTALKTKLTDMSAVKTVTYASRNQELKQVVGHYGQAFGLFAGDENPLNDVYIVTAKQPTQTITVAKTARQLPYVATANYGGNQTKQLFQVMGTIRLWASGLMLLLLLVAIFLISNTIRITIMSREAEIGVMRLVGATNAYIRWPFFLEGAWTGLLGSLLPMVLIDIGYHWVYQRTATELVNFGYTLASPGQFLVLIDLVLLSVGMLIGAIGAMISMRRYLKV